MSTETKDEEFDKDTEFKKYNDALTQLQRHNDVFRPLQKRKYFLDYPNDAYMKLKKEIESRHIFCNDISTVNDALHISYEKLGCFLRSRLGLKAFVSLLELHHQDTSRYYDKTLLMLMSHLVDAIPDNVLLLIEEFFESLPIEETLRYINEVNENGHSIIFKCKNMKLMNILMKYINNIMDYDKHSYNMLMYACNGKQKSLDKINLLLDCGTNINATDSNNRTALLICCASFSPFYGNDDDARKNVVDVIELLIHRGADVSVKSINGRTAFDCLPDKHKFDPQLLALLRGTTRINRTKKAMQM